MKFILNLAIVNAVQYYGNNLDMIPGYNGTISWRPETLPECPEDDSRLIMDDGSTTVVRYPHVGATCMGSPWPEAKGTKQAQDAIKNGY